MKKFLLAVLTCLLFLGIYSCKKDKAEINFNPNVLSSKDYISAEDALFEIVNTFYKGINDTLVNENYYGYIDNCGISWYPGDSLLMFGYGTENRMCQDGKFRRGSFYAHFSGNRWDDGVTATLSTDQLMVDDSLVEAQMVFTKNGLNSDNLMEFTLDVQYCKIRPDDTTKFNPVTISAGFILEWSEGSATPEIHEDDIYLVSGTASGSSSDGYVFQVEIQDPLVNPVDCFWIYSGISRIDVPEAEVTSGTIDYIPEDGCFNKMNFYFNDNLFYHFLK